MVRNRAALRKGLIRLDERVRSLVSEEAKAAVKAVDAVLKRAEAEVGEDLTIGKLKGKKLIPFLEEIEEILEPFKGQDPPPSNPGSSSISGGSGSKSVEPENQGTGAKSASVTRAEEFIASLSAIETPPEYVVAVLDEVSSYLAEGLPVAEIAKAMGSNLQEAWRRYKKEANQAKVAALEAAATGPQVGEESIEEGKPSHQTVSADAGPPPSKNLGSDMETTAPEHESAPTGDAPTPEKVGRCPFPISRLYNEPCAPRPGRIFEIRPGKWARWLEYLFGGTDKQEMCNTCFDRLTQILRMDDAEVRQELAKIAKAAGRPFPKCAYRVTEECEPDVAPGAFWIGRDEKTPEIGLFLSERDRERGEGHCCAPCHALLLDLVKTYDEGGQEKLQKLLLEKRGIKFVQPTPEPVEEKEILVCADCDTTSGLVADGEETVCNVCSLIRSAEAKGLPDGKIRHAKALRNKGEVVAALEYLKKILSEVSRQQGATTEVAEGKPCLNPFSQYKVKCTGTAAVGDVLCGTCRGFWESVPKYKGPRQRLRRDTVYYYRCSNQGCRDPWSLTGQELINLGPPPLETLLCHACYKKRVAAELAEAPDCPTYKGYEGCQGKRNLKKRSGDGNPEYYPLCAACYARKKQDEAEAKAAARANPKSAVSPQGQNLASAGMMA